MDKIGVKKEIKSKQKSRAFPYFIKINITQINIRYLVRKVF